ncbi:bacteriocin-like protein, partial [Elizabethkingia miricola]
LLINKLNITKMKKLKKISRNELKKINGGFGPEPDCGESWSASMGPRCSCIMEGGSWICDKCYTDLPNRITSILANNCDEFNNWPR